MNMLVAFIIYLTEEVNMLSFFIGCIVGAGLGFIVHALCVIAAEESPREREDGSVD